MLQRLFWVLSCLLILSLSAQAQDPLASVKDKIKNERLEEAKSELGTIIAAKPKNLDECYYWQGIINFYQDTYSAAQTSFPAGLTATSRC